MSESQIGILLVDDHQLVREGLRLLIDREADMQVLGEAGDGDAALFQVEVLQPDLILLDVEMPGCSGIDLIQSLRAKRPGVKIILLTGLPPQEWIEEAVQAGISGSIMKTDAGAELIHAIRVVMSGKAYITPDIAAALLDSRAGHAYAPQEDNGRQLSEREIEVIKRVATGQTTKEIAEALQLSAKTIEARRLQIMAKIGVNSVAELTKYAIRHGLTPLS